MSYSISELAQKVNGVVIGEKDLPIKGITDFEHPQKDCVTFVTNPRDLRELEQTEIACLIVPNQISESKKRFPPPQELLRASPTRRAGSFSYVTIRYGTIHYGISQLYAL